MFTHTVRPFAINFTHSSKSILSPSSGRGNIKPPLYPQLKGWAKHSLHLLQDFTQLGKSHQIVTLLYLSCMHSKAQLSNRGTQTQPSAPLVILNGSISLPFIIKERQTPLKSRLNFDPWTKD